MWQCGVCVVVCGREEIGRVRALCCSVCCFNVCRDVGWKSNDWRYIYLSFNTSFILNFLSILFPLLLILSNPIQLDTKLSDVQQKEKIKDTKLNQIWNILTKYCEWDSLMGSSIQPDAKENTKPEVLRKSLLFCHDFYYYYCQYCNCHH